MVDTQYISCFNIGGLNLYENPIYPSIEEQQASSDGQLIRSVNFISYPLGAKMKRPGYTTFLGTADGASVNTLFSWLPDNSNSSFLYRFSGSQLWYYDASVGTATNWAVCGNGTFAGGSHVGYTTVNNTLIIGDGVGSTRHTTNGTAFTNTTDAPAGEFWEQYQTRAFSAGTTGTVNFSVGADATNWQTSGTSDSSNWLAMGAGKPTKLFKLGDRLHLAKSSGNIYRYDGYSVVDIATGVGPTSPYSFGTIENYALYLNRTGVYLMDSNQPKLISNPIRSLIYNEAETGIAGTTFNSAQGIAYKYDYHLAVGSVRDDFTNEPLNNGILNYNVNKNEWLTHQFNDNPTTFGTYLDNVGSQHLLFGNSSGQVFKYGLAATSDNGVAVSATMELLFTANVPHLSKDWRWFWGFFNPGCEAQIQIAFSDTFIRGAKNWIDIGDASSGVVQFHFPAGARSKLLYLRIKDASKTARMIFYGANLAYKLVDPG